MLCFDLTLPVFCCVLHGPFSHLLFAEDFQKKRLLDIVRYEMLRDRIFLLGYCILDNQGCLILQSRSLSVTEKTLLDIQRRYERSFPDLFSVQKSRDLRMQVHTKQLSSVDQAFHLCICLHSLPVRKHYAKRPGDYWWSSYLDYCGRTSYCLIDVPGILSVQDLAPSVFLKQFHKIHRQHLHFC